jgi:ATPase subunit of ABC transporter with duplicated ATPase domains
MTNIEELKKKRDQLAARIQQAEAKEKQQAKKEDNRVKILVGSAILNAIKNGLPIEIEKPNQILILMNNFLERPGDRTAILGKEGKGSEALKRLAAPLKFAQSPTPS